MTRRTTRLTAENLERRTMMAADLGIASTFAVAEDPITHEAEVDTNEQGPFVCGVDTSAGSTTATAELDQATSTPPLAGDTPDGTVLGAAGNGTTNMAGATSSGAGAAQNTQAIDMTFASYQ